MFNDPNEKLRELMRRLVVATRTGVVSWTADDDGFTFNFDRSESSVVLSTKDNDGLAPFVLEVFDGAGRLVENFRTTSIRGTLSPYIAEANQEIAELYEAVRRQAFRVDDVLDGLMADLPPAPEPDPWA